MRLAFKISAVTLLAGIVVVTLTSPLTAAAVSQPRAGCHSHAHKIPAPGPVSYTCCQTGHGSPLLQEAVVFSPLAINFSPVVEVSEPSPVLTSLRRVRYLITPSSSPPGNIPQRI